MTDIKCDTLTENQESVRVCVWLQMRVCSYAYKYASKEANTTHNGKLSHIYEKLHKLNDAVYAVAGGEGVLVGVYR